MNNEHEHIYDDCIGNPPFAEAMKTLGGGMNTEWKLTEEQQRFFDEKKGRVSNLPEDATEREKEFAKTAKFFIGYAEDLQNALNRKTAMLNNAEKKIQDLEREVNARTAIERQKFSIAFGTMISCYRAIDRHFGDEIRANLEKNDRTEKEGKMRALMEQMQRLTK